MQLRGAAGHGGQRAVPERHEQLGQDLESDVHLELYCAMPARAAALSLSLPLFLVDPILQTH